MNLADRLIIIKKLREQLQNLALDDNFLAQVALHNPWFIPRFSSYALEQICINYLDESKLIPWLESYSNPELKPQSIGLVLAGNVPLVGFFDIFCSYFTASSIQVKLSSKDTLLTSKVLEIWTQLDPDFASRLQVVERLGKVDKVIATGSNNTYRYFEQYFGQYRNILRKNRTSIAVIPADISDDDLTFLMDDIFIYFGLGCRNVSRVFMENGFDYTRLISSSMGYNFLFDQQKYMNNYDFNRTVYLLNKIPFFCNNFMIIREDTALYSPIAVTFFSYYNQLSEVDSYIQAHQDQIQCVVGKDIPYGMSQSPSLTDYADNMDVMNFLISN